MNLIEIIKDLTQDCNCGLSEGLQYHVNNKVPLTENIYRPSSKKYFELFEEARQLHKQGKLQLTEDETKILENTDLGKFGVYNGIRVPLDFPMSEEQLLEVKHQGKEVKLNKPKRSSGPKKYMVFVRKPGGGIKKISFGDAKGGLKMKISDPKARKAFAKRHNCASKKDKLTPGYWSCRLPRYSSMLGLKSNFGGYW